MVRRGERQRVADHAPRPCPCGADAPYADCCGRLHRGAAAAPTAEALMRSRYSAFAVADAGYLLTTWHPSTRPDRLRLASEQRWTRLDVVSTSRGGLLDTTGTVEFRAHYRCDGRAGVLHEHSRFVREHGHWRYLDALPTA